MVDQVKWAVNLSFIQMKTLSIQLRAPLATVGSLRVLRRFSAWCNYHEGALLVLPGKETCLRMRELNGGMMNSVGLILESPIPMTT